MTSPSGHKFLGILGVLLDHLAEISILRGYLDDVVHYASGKKERQIYKGTKLIIPLHYKSANTNLQKESFFATQTIGSFSLGDGAVLDYELSKRVGRGRTSDTSVRL